MPRKLKLPWAWHWESMYVWRANGERGVWLFHTQSELAGYCSVMHSLQLLGIKGWHDQPRRAAIISFGASGRGSIHALQGLDFNDITVFTLRSPGEILCTIPGVKYRQYERGEGGDDRVLFRGEDGRVRPFGEELAGYDIAQLPMTQLCRGWALAWPLDLDPEVVPNV